MPYNVAANLRIATPDPIGVDQLKRKNALADMAAQTDQNRNALYAQQISQNEARMRADEEAALLAQIKDWAPGAYRRVLANPAEAPTFVAQAQKFRITAPDFDVTKATPADVEEIASHLGLEKPQAPVPFENTPEGIKLAEQRRQFDARMGLDRQKFAAEQRTGAPGKEPNKQLVTRPTPDGRQQDYAFNPQTSQLEPVGQPYAAGATQKPLPVVLEKRLIDVNEASFGARASSTRYEGIATEMERVIPAAGLRAKWTESFKELTGSEDAITELRKNYSAVRFSAAVKNLPPGPATDRDIQLALGGFLPENANPKAVSSFLRGLAKMESIKADYHEFESQYITENRTLAGFSEAWQAHAAQAYPKAGAAPSQPRQVVRRGKTKDGRSVVQYSDGTIEEAR